MQIPFYQLKLSLFKGYWWVFFLRVEIVFGFDSHTGHCGKCYQTLNKYHLILCFSVCNEVKLCLDAITSKMSSKPIEIILVRVALYLCAYPTHEHPHHFQKYTHTHLILSTSRIKKSFFLTGRTNDRISISSEAMNTNNYDVVIETMHIKQVELTKSRHDPSYCSHKTVFTLLHNFGVRCLFNMISQTLPIHSMYMYVFRNSNAQNKHDTFWATEKKSSLSHIRTHAKQVIQILKQMLGYTFKVMGEISSPRCL